MNYFAHGLPYLDRPEFLAGTAVPDWLSVVDRKVRVRERLAEPFLHDHDESRRELAAGVVQHLRDDHWFHGTRAFAEVTAQLAVMFRAALGGTDGFRPGFLGHIVTEMLLDRVLIVRHPEKLEQYYRTLREVSPGLLERSVNAMARGSTDRLAAFVPLFLRERFLFDYEQSEAMLVRLNQVMRRIKLEPLPATCLPVIEEGFDYVESHAEALLPPPVRPYVT